MKAYEKVLELSQKIQKTLPTLIGRSCVYVDLPYYANVGDVLIWEGTEAFLKKNHIKVVYSGSWDTFDFRPLPKDVPIVMQGPTAMSITFPLSANSLNSLSKPIFFPS